MTPFAEKIRDLRAEVGVTLKQMAAALEVSPAYLSALEHGHRGRPSPGLIRQIRAQAKNRATSSGEFNPR